LDLIIHPTVSEIASFVQLVYPAPLTCVNGTWISEDGGPVEVVFEWQRHSRKEAISESDCVCSKELAARLIHLLLTGAEDGSEVNDLFELPLPGRGTGICSDAYDC
jgi:hypothetical protein